MGERSLRKLDAAAIGRCASIVGIQRRADFDREVPRLISMACALAGRSHGTTRQRAARAKIMKTGRALVRAVRDAPPETSRPIQLFLPFGVTSLELLINEVARERPERVSSVRRRDQFVIMLFIAVEKAGGTLHVTKLAKLLDVLKPYLPEKFLGGVITGDIVRRLSNGANWRQHSTLTAELVRLALHAKNEATRTLAIRECFDRMLGKPTIPVEGQVTYGVSAELQKLLAQHAGDSRSIPSRTSGLLIEHNANGSDHGNNGGDDGGGLH